MRTNDAPTAPSSSKSVAASAAPNCTEAIAERTRATGGTGGTARRVMIAASDDALPAEPPARAPRRRRQLGGRCGDAASEPAAPPAATTTPPASSEPASGAAASFERDQIFTASDGTEIPFTLVVPAGFETGDEHPVLLALPPGGQGQEEVDAGLARYWEPEALERGWVIVSPVAPGAPSTSRAPSATCPGSSTPWRPSFGPKAVVSTSPASRTAACRHSRWRPRTPSCFARCSHCPATRRTVSLEDLAESRHPRVDTGRL